MTTSPSRQALVAALRQELSFLESQPALPPENLISTGSPALDRLLPRGGLRPGTLVEYLAPSPASGAGALALAAARQACSTGRALIVFDQEIQPPKPRSASKGIPPSQARRASEGTSPQAHGATKQSPAPRFYPPAASAWGLDLSRLIVLRPPTQEDALWALDQALRCRGVGAVWARCNEFDPRDFRRLQLAAEEGGTLALFLRPTHRRGHPTWAEVQWLIRPVQSTSPSMSPTSSTPRQKRPATSHPRPITWRLHVELVRCRGGSSPEQAQSLLLELDPSTRTWCPVSHATDSLPLPAQLADPAPIRRA